MQTFLPEASFQQSMSVLDDKRLGKQRVEAKQILRALRGETTGWVHHPATKMWRGYEGALSFYGYTACAQWIMRGFDDNLQLYFLEHLESYSRSDMPPWFGWRDFHLAHQSNLVRKDPGHYRRFYPNVPDNLPYIWPTIL